MVMIRLEACKMQAWAVTCPCVCCICVKFCYPALHILQHYMHMHAAHVIRLLNVQKICNNGLLNTSSWKSFVTTHPASIRLCLASVTLALARCFASHRRGYIEAFDESTELTQSNSRFNKHHPEVLFNQSL